MTVAEPTPNVALRDAFGRALVDIGAEDHRIVVVDPDLGNGTGASLFAAAMPDRYFQVGIAEQNSIGVAAGLASCGYIPFVVTFAAFAATRCLDQIRVSVAQPRLPVVIVGGHAGMFAGRLGKTHVCMEDLAIFRAIPNMTVAVPGDASEMRAVVRASAAAGGPVYLRSGRDPIPAIFGADLDFEFGRARRLRDGDEVALISLGTQTHRALEAAASLEVEGLSTSVLHVATLKPLDRAAVISAARQARVTITIEDHSVIGGLGSAVAEVLAEEGGSVLRRMGSQDTYIESAGNDALLEKYGPTTGQIVVAAKEALRQGAATRT